MLQSYLSCPRAPLPGVYWGYISDNDLSDIYDVSPGLPQVELPSLEPPLYLSAVLFFLATNHKYRNCHLSKVQSVKVSDTPRGVIIAGFDG